jgi:hypothetical protein
MKLFDKLKSFFAPKGARTQIKAKVIAASMAPSGKMIYTLLLTYNRFFHSELMTHRALSKNSMSSRAVPVKKMLSQVWNDPALPVHWGRNRPGMQAKEELQGFRLWLVQRLWALAGRLMCCIVWWLDKLELHKQVANRLLEPWQWMHVVLTGTEFDNFFELRRHADAQPEFRVLANAMWDVMSIEAMSRNGVTIRHLTINTGKYTDWHLPFIGIDEMSDEIRVGTLIKMSVARCARVSYLNHDGTKPSLTKDLDLYDRLVGSRPIHASPTEHQASAREDSTYVSNNFRGFEQYRRIMVIPKERR